MGRFGWQNALQTVAIESGVKFIRESAFTGCKALNAIVIPATVKGKLQPIATLSPVGAQEKLTWSCSNKNVASVSSGSVVTAKEAGTAKLTVKMASGKKATVTIKVSKQG